MFFKKAFWYLWNGGLDPESTEPDLLRERRTISTSILVLMPLGITVIVINMALGLPQDNPIIASGLLFVCSALYVQSKWNSPKIAANMAVFGFWLILVLVMSTSGILGQTWLWLFGVPAMAALLGGLISGVFWSVACATTIWVFAVLHLNDRLILDDQVKVLDHAYVLGLATEGTLVLVLLCVAVLIFRHGENKAEEKLKKTVVTLKTEVHHRGLAEEKARVSEQSKSAFLAAMSHELRTPLNGVIGAIRLLLDSDVEKEKLEYANVARESGEMLLELINNIMDLSSLESGSVRLENIAVDLRSLLTKTMAPFEFQAQNKNLDFQIEVDDATPEYVMGDPTRIRQVLINLVGNALKFTENGEIEISVDVIGEHLSIIVSDSGIGIPQEALGSLFEAYVQADSSTTRIFGGSGLGLSIVKKLITNMKGSIKVTSVPGEGSKFSILLPCVVGEFVPETLEEVIEDDIVPMKILVADDNAVNRMVLSRLLEKDDHSIVSVADGREAVDYVSCHKVDVVLMDIQMPVLDGISATEEIRGLDGEKSSTPIIAITANTSSQEVDRMMAAGMNDYVSKPFRYEDLRDVLRPH